MAGNIRSALHPLAKDIDADVLEYIASSAADIQTETDLIEHLSLYIPGFDELSKNQKSAKAKAVRLSLSAPPSSATDGPITTSILDSLAAQVAAASLGSHSTQQADSAARKQESQEKVVPPALRQAVDSLRGLLPHLSPSEAVYALGQCRGSVECAADYCCEHNVAALVQAEQAQEGEREKAREAARAEEARAEEEARRRVKERYDEVEEDKGRRYTPTLPKDMGGGQARKKGEKILAFIDNQPVYVRPGEKYITEKAPEPAPGTTVGPAGVAVPLKMKKKGQGGASPGFR